MLTIHKFHKVNLLSYTDYGHSFDQAIFYGHEATLQMFEILFFTMVDFIFQDYVFAAIATYGIDVVSND